AFSPPILGGCVQSIYGGDALPQPGTQFYAVFGASLLCDYTVSEAFPLGEAFSADGCEGLQDLAQKILPSAATGPSNQPPATVLPATNPPATNPPATNPPATNPPATNPPATNPPATNLPATNPPATN